MMNNISFCSQGKFFNFEGTLFANHTVTTTVMHAVYESNLLRAAYIVQKAGLTSFQCGDVFGMNFFHCLMLNPVNDRVIRKITELAIIFDAINIATNPLEGADLDRFDEEKCLPRVRVTPLYLCLATTCSAWDTVDRVGIAALLMRNGAALFRNNVVIYPTDLDEAGAAIYELAKKQLLKPSELLVLSCEYDEGSTFSLLPREVRHFIVQFSLPGID